MFGPFDLSKFPLLVNRKRGSTVLLKQLCDPVLQLWRSSQLQHFFRRGQRRETFEHVAKITEFAW